MSLACLLCEHKLAYRAVEGRAIPESGWMRQHLDSCARCAESLSQLGGLSRRLNEMKGSFSDGSMQKAAILERVAGLPNPRRSYAVPSAALAACAVLLVWMISRPEQSPQLPSLASSSTTRHAKEPKVIVAAVPKNVVKRSEVTKVRKA